MSENQPSNAKLVRLLEPWFPVFAEIGSAALRDFKAAIPLLGPPRKTERANDLHRAWRNNFRRACDFAEPLIILREEPDGEGLDYLLCQMNPDIPFVLRWARFDGEAVRRNRTQRSKQVQEQGRLFASMERDATELPTVTLGHTIEDEYTEAGRSCLWIGKLVLLRERWKESEVIAEAHVYSPPGPDASVSGEAPAPLISARQGELEQWGQMINRIRSA